MMFYKNGPSYGIRRRHGAQVFNVCKKGVPVEVLKVIAQKAVTSLNKGMDVEVAKLLVKHKLNTMGSG